MAPKLYSTRLSPCARAVEMLAQAIGLELDVVTVDLDGSHTKGEMARINPKHTVPTLDDDGFHLWDSHAIMIYLAEKYGKGNPIYPQDVKRRALVNLRLFFDGQDLFGQHKSVIFPLAFGSAQALSEKDIQSVADHYATVEYFLKDGKYLVGNELTIADISVWCTITNTFTYSPLDGAKYPKVKAWCKRMEQLPYANINIEGGKAFGQMIDSLRNRK